MKIASVLLLTLVGVLALPVLLSVTPHATAGVVTPPNPVPDRVPARAPDPTQLPPVTAQYAIVPITGRELVESILEREELRLDAIPEPRQPHLDRSPERQARGLSGSA